MEFKNTPPIEKKEKITLPDSFTMKLEGDFTSSGATRTYKSTLIFIDGKLVSGEANLFVGGCDGVNTTYDAKLIDNKWIDNKTNQLCLIDFNRYNSVTKEGLEENINLGIIKPDNGSPGHLDISYKIVN